MQQLLEALNVIGQYLLPASLGAHFSTHPAIEHNPEFSGLKLMHVVRELSVFSLDATAAPLQVNEADSHLNSDSYLNSAVLRSESKMVPKFLPHTDANSVLKSWKASALDGSEQRMDPAYWRVGEYAVPNITDKETVLTLAKLAANAYVPVPHEGDWSDVNGTRSGNWTHDDEGYGWDNDGLRGYVFTSEDERMMVLSIKGTSTPVWNNGGPTAPNDKLNDNLFFSCCCARITSMWSTVCDCFLGDNTCDQQCLDRELVREDRYYRQILEVFDTAMALVPKVETVWITGHSLGGALSSMLGRTYGIPVVTFEAPGEALPVRRLHLPVPPGMVPWDDYIYHFGHNADPIYMGTCNGRQSTCWLKGYAMETKCHSGQVCIYDVREDLGWHESIANHRIHVVIDNVIGAYDEPAHCVAPEPCQDCEAWDFVDPLSRLPNTRMPRTTSNTATSTRTTRVHTSSKKGKKTTTTPEPTDCLRSSCLERGWYGACNEWSTCTTKPPMETHCEERNWYGRCERYVTEPDEC